MKQPSELTEVLLWFASGPARDTPSGSRCSGTWVVAAAERPNILLIMSDDMGFSDLGCYGGEIQTPNLDSLAKEGVRFTQFYNMGRCCPTRASLLTGLYPHQAGVGHMTRDSGHDGYRGQLNHQSATIAEVLGAGGYRTYMCGKWHVTRFDGADAPDKSSWPVQRGFEKFYGTIRGGGSFYDPTGLCRQNTFITPENDPEYKPAKFYYTDAISDNAVRFLQSARAGSRPTQPFFMYVAYTAAHWPMHALEKDIAKYKGKFDGGYEPVRQARLERLKQLGLVDSKWDLSPQAGDWSRVEEQSLGSPLHGGVRGDGGLHGPGHRPHCGAVETVRPPGQHPDLLPARQRRLRRADGPRRCPPINPPAPRKPMGPDDLQHQTWPPMQTRDGRWLRRGPGVMPGPEDTYVGYGGDWANVSNTPFREYKHWVHEGGISTPSDRPLASRYPARSARASWSLNPAT